MYLSYHFETQYWSLDNIYKLFIKENALKENAVHGTERRVHNATKQTNSHANAMLACLTVNVLLIFIRGFMNIQSLK